MSREDFGTMQMSTESGQYVTLTFPWRMTDKDIEDATTVCTMQLRQVARARVILAEKEARYQRLKEFAP